MGKVVNITEKLNFEEKPEIVIKGVHIKVNNDAKSMLAILGVMEDDASEAELIIKATEALFDKAEKKKLDGLNLSIKDYATVIEIAMDLARGEESDDTSGEQ